MKPIKFAAFILTLLSISLGLKAQTLNGFSSFSPQGPSENWGAYFGGDWSADGFGTGVANTFIQNAETFDIIGRNENINNYADFYFGVGDAATTVSMGSESPLSFTGNLLSGNVASGFNISLFSSNASQFAVYNVSTASLSEISSTIILSLTNVDASFNWNEIEGFRIVGTSVGAGTAFAVRFDNLSAVPEPATFAALAGMATLGLAVVRRRKRAV